MGATGKPTPIPVAPIVLGAPDFPAISIRRTGETVTGASGVRGRRLLLACGTAVVYGVEDDPTDGSSRAIPAGRHSAEMRSMATKKERDAAGNLIPMRGIRILDWPTDLPAAEREHFIHVANDPKELDGCMASGLLWSSTGVSSSRSARDLLVEACGGWAEGRRVYVDVKE